MSDLLITPKTKIGELLSAYPQLEDTLLTLSPQFHKLKNPVLRRTIGRVATLQQVSLVGNISINELVNTLRKQVGQGEYSVKSGDSGMVFKRPAWFSPDKVTIHLDVRPVIDEGENPLQQIMQNVKNLQDNDIMELHTSFIPSPVIEKLEERGYNHWTKKESNNLFITYFCKRQDV